MRVLVVAHGPAHVPWIIPLSWACRLAGHEVRVAARPECVGLVTRSGLPAVSIGDDDASRTASAVPVRPALARRRAPVPPTRDGRPAGLTPEIQAALTAKMIGIADLVADDLVAFARSWKPDLVLHDTAAAAGLVAAAVTGAPAVGNSWGLAAGVAVQKPEDVTPEYARLFERFGVEPLVGPATWIDACPPRLRPDHPVRRVDMRFVPYGGPGIVHDWVGAPRTRPRVCVTGGVTTASLEGFLGRTIHAVQELGAEVVVAGHGGEGLPDGVRAVESFPLDVLLPTCDTVVHHGGFGTGMIALDAGIPQVVVPRNSAQEHWGDLVESAGAGISLNDPELPGVSAIGTAVSAVLGAGYVSRARLVQAEIAGMPDPADVVGFLEEHAGARA
ncbi:nucleotide disphospho-sugar-binding domain-containing protein [Actinomadura montaniterrae]|uniref:DUF1205 domain-containing protein n=1 Tax=Actinomadura montaniterrae TaxID=1803903 RepID=A0A6L3W231_9ACTN|nr:nucleotide disphospho-sugar-binding domain-containing protein [Actinomadura montaniterrae]KAB2381586.1 DUF1205 domain-containing protein [Actinomadura montaniterrae]